MTLLANPRIGLMAPIPVPDPAAPLADAEAVAEAEAGEEAPTESEERLRGERGLMAGEPSLLRPSTSSPSSSIKVGCERDIG
jgi:hypothetical protein